MKILLDECLPIDLRHSFPNHAAHTVQWAGLKSKKNGELLRAAEPAGYDGRSRANQLEDLLPLAAGILRAPGPVKTGRLLPAK